MRTFPKVVVGEVLSTTYGYGVVGQVEPNVGQLFVFTTENFNLKRPELNRCSWPVRCDFGELYNGISAENLAKMAPGFKIYKTGFNLLTFPQNKSYKEFFLSENQLIPWTPNVLFRYVIEGQKFCRIDSSLELQKVKLQGTQHFYAIDNESKLYSIPNNALVILQS
jgi:hypothetical protein